MDSFEFFCEIRELKKCNPQTEVLVVADLSSLDEETFVQKARFAKAVLDQGFADSITILCTESQYRLEVNAFQSGVKAIDANLGKRLK